MYRNSAEDAAVAAEADVCGVRAPAAPAELVAREEAGPLRVRGTPAAPVRSAGLGEEAAWGRRRPGLECGEEGWGQRRRGLGRRRGGLVRDEGLVQLPPRGGRGAVHRGAGGARGTRHEGDSGLMMGTCV
jgi:hypothetical protein